MVPAVKALLKKTGFGLKDIDVFEVNEAFAAQALAVARGLELPADRTNPNGSGISLGHPIGATGCILAIKALCELRRTGGKRVRARATLNKVEDVPGGIQVTVGITFEVEGSDKPVCVAEGVYRYYA